MCVQIPNFFMTDTILLFIFKIRSDRVKERRFEFITDYGIVGHVGHILFRKFFVAVNEWIRRNRVLHNLTYHQRTTGFIGDQGGSEAGGESGYKGSGKY